MSVSIYFPFTYDIYDSSKNRYIKSTYIKDGWKHVGFIGSWFTPPERLSEGLIALHDDLSREASRKLIEKFKKQILENIKTLQEQGKSVVVGVTNNSQYHAVIALTELGFSSGRWCGSLRYTTSDTKLWWKNILTDDVDKKFKDYFKKQKLSSHSNHCRYEYKEKFENFNRAAFPTVCTSKILNGLENYTGDKAVNLIQTVIAQSWELREGMVVACTTSSQTEINQILFDLNFESSELLTVAKGEKVKLWWFAIQETHFESKHKDTTKSPRKHLDKPFKLKVCS